METFKRYLNKFINVNDEEFAFIFQIKEVQKKEDLLAENEVCKFKYFVLKSCLRKFFINEKGGDQTTEFAIENWWMTYNFAFENKAKTHFNIQAVEKSKSTILIINLASQELLLQAHSIMERYLIPSGFYCL